MDVDSFLAHHGIKGQRWGVRNSKGKSSSGKGNKHVAYTGKKIPVKKQSFLNELGNKIDMSVTADHRGITVVAEGPTSISEHTWTLKEAKALKEMLP